MFKKYYKVVFRYMNTALTSVVYLDEKMSLRNAEKDGLDMFETMVFQESLRNKEIIGSHRLLSWHVELA